MAFRKLRRRRKPSEIPTSSMADIAFLLIIFFMLTTVFTTNQGIQFQYPEDDPNDPDVQPEEAIHIKIEGEGRFQIDKNPTSSLEEIGGYVRAKMEQSPEKPVIIESDPDVPYFVMIDVFDLLKQLEVKNIAVPTKSERARWKAFFR